MTNAFICFTAQTFLLAWFPFLATSRMSWTCRRLFNSCARSSATVMFSSSLSVSLRARLRGTYQVLRSHHAEISHFQPGHCRLVHRVPVYHAPSSRYGVLLSSAHAWRAPRPHGTRTRVFECSSNGEQRAKLLHGHGRSRAATGSATSKQQRWAAPAAWSHDRDPRAAGRLQCQSCAYMWQISPTNCSPAAAAGEDDGRGCNGKVGAGVLSGARCSVLVAHRNAADHLGRPHFPAGGTSDASPPRPVSCIGSVQRPPKLAPHYCLFTTAG